MAVPTEHEWYMYFEPTFKNLINIDKSLITLLERRYREKCGSTKSEIDKDIRTAIQNLRANALYVAGTNSSFEKDLDKLYDRTMKHWSTAGTNSSFEKELDKLYDKTMKHWSTASTGRRKKFLDSRDDLEVHFVDLFRKIMGGIRQKGEEAMLGDVSLKPFLEAGEIVQREEIRKHEELTSKLLLKEEEERKKKEEKKNEAQEKYWDQYVVEESVE